MKTDHILFTGIVILYICVACVFTRKNKNNKVL